MSEQLGDAVLVLRTDDRGLNAGVDQAESKSRQLGRTLDATSGSATKLGSALAETGSSAKAASGKTQEYSADVARLKAQVDPAWASLMKFRDGAQLARTALEQGAISHRQYVEYMRQSAQAAGLLTNAQGKLTAATGAQRAGMSQLAMNVNDMSTMYALGARPMQIFSSQMGQTLQAIQLMSGGTNGLMKILGSPWTLLVSSAALALVPLIGKLFETEDATSKTSKASQSWADRLDLSKNSLREVTQALREYNAEQKKANEITLESAKLEAQRTYQAWQTVLALRQKLAAELAANEASASANAGQGTGGAAGAFTSGQLDRTRSRIAENEKAIASAEEAYRNASSNVAAAIAKLDTDPTTRIRTGFDLLRKKARETITDVEKLRQRYAELNRQEEAALKKARDAERSDGAASNRQFGREIGISEAQIIARSAGLRVTSGERSYSKQKALYDAWVAAGRPADNPVAKPGSSAHERNNGLDIAFGAGVSPASIRKAFEDEGVRLTKILKERGHYHIEWSRSGADRAANSAEREQEKEERRQESLNRDLAGLMQEAVNLRRQMADTVEERYQIEREALDTAIEEQKRRINANNDYTQAEKDKLLAQLEIKAGLERELLDRRRREEVARQALEVAQALQANEAELLQKQLSLTGTREKRREIEQQLLDLAYTQRRQALEAIKPGDPRYAAAQIDLANLGAQRAADQKLLDRQYASPIQRYIRELKGLDISINDQLGNVAVDGLKTLEDRLVDVIMRTKSLGAAFKDVSRQIIADLLRIALQRQVIAPLAELLFGPATGSSGGGGGDIVLGGALTKFLGGIGGGSNNIATGETAGMPDSWWQMLGGFGLGGNFGLGGLLGKAGGGLLGKVFGGFFADGGLIPSGTFGIVGERGPEPVISTSSGTLVRPNSALSEMRGGGGPRRLEINVSGARGNREIMEMVNAGVAQGLAAYDSVVGDRVQDHLARRG
ncbi:Prophage tail length tape measure protein [Sphingobium faniae]|nr:Prophage tail length tape measure protein [Sphingobium faniae]